MTTIFRFAHRVHWVLDNLNIHLEQALRKILGNHPVFDRVCFHYTPRHGSWLNQAEIEISTLSCEALPDRIASEIEVRKSVGVYLKRRNKLRKTINWRFTWAKAETKFKLSKVSPINA